VQITKDLRVENFGQNPAKHGVSSEVRILKDLTAEGRPLKQKRQQDAGAPVRNRGFLYLEVYARSKAVSTGKWGLLTKNHSAQFIAEAPGFLLVSGVVETVCQFELLLVAHLGVCGASFHVASDRCLLQR